jgi:hypothetical protein
MNQPLGSPASARGHAAGAATSKVRVTRPNRDSRITGGNGVSTSEFPTWVIALPIIAAVVVLAGPSVEIIARNLRRVGSAGIVGGVSTTVIALAATQTDPSLLPVAVAAGAASTAATGYFAHPERAWFGKRLAAARFKRTDIKRTKTSKRAHRSLGNAPVKRTNVPRIKRG